MAIKGFLTEQCKLLVFMLLYVVGLACATIAIIYSIPTWLMGVNNSYVNTRVAFYCIVTAMGFLYVNLLLSALACMYGGYALMRVLTVSYGILLPTSAVAILGSSIYVTASNAVDFPAILGIVAGGLLLLFYLSMLLYDRQYQRSSYDHRLKYTDLSGRNKGTREPLVTDTVVNINRYHFKFQ